MTPPAILSTINIQIAVSPFFLFVVGALVIAGWLVFTVIIRYHWKNYGTGGMQLFAMNFLYISGSAALAGLMILSAVLYLISAQ
ncbi:MAG: hypothetical protein A2845_03850 [Candidatus Lloydbacteria bacterium RIFCSPHIGHO2_01_FULL_49_22]|uniref:DUF5671 domain-containing protein n=1 Tax=Candidatus Lloydbacteria bacterium RIFCSPHIGHO2_01_FULL_49_22 TaxID=1798658 RepID=A0A1G2CX95_9BACT|nr:MAG: hypothetical protein A2845_03850 [Candidatus Lloydbacteria bacterium RIFCSPHIGHO2_01_FULL_49_22]OGZ09060.1 MAG: hypothetical protein A3C14_03685 [Candidatus Lloydbacteria bacterium RIFCSPHIGHO2_02_FULL_50_18]